MQWGQRLPIRLTPIQTRELVREYPYGNGICDDVMFGKRERVTIFIPRDDDGPPEWPSRQRKGTTERLEEPRVRVHVLLRPQIHDFERNRPVGRDQRAWRLGAIGKDRELRKRGSQRFVTAHENRKAPAKELEIERPGHLEREELGVLARVRREATDEVKALLAQREAEEPRVVAPRSLRLCTVPVRVPVDRPGRGEHRRRSCRRGTRCCDARQEMIRQLPGRGRIEREGRRQCRLDPLAERVHELDGHQRVEPELLERPIDVDGVRIVEEQGPCDLDAHCLANLLLGPASLIASRRLRG
jgi:hypothetical protein